MIGRKIPIIILDTKYKQKKGFSKKALGLGVAAGFVGGAAVGVAGTMATYSVYHRNSHIFIQSYISYVPIIITQ